MTRPVSRGNTERPRRIHALISMVLLYGCATGTMPGDDYEQTLREYRELRKKWEGEARKASFSSDTHDYWTGPSGRSLVAMGRRALPLVILEIRAGDFFFNVAAAGIAGPTVDRVVRGEAPGSEQSVASRWAAWWEAVKGDPAWNPHLDDERWKLLDRAFRVFAKFPPAEWGPRRLERLRAARIITPDEKEFAESFELWETARRHLESMKPDPS